MAQQHQDGFREFCHSQKNILKKSTELKLSSIFIAEYSTHHNFISFTYGYAMCATNCRALVKE